MIILFILSSIIFIFFLYTFHRMLWLSFKSTLNNNWSLKVLSVILWYFLRWRFVYIIYSMFSFLDTVKKYIRRAFSFEAIIHRWTHRLTPPSIWPFTNLGWHSIFKARIKKLLLELWIRISSKVFLNYYMLHHSLCCWPPTTSSSLRTTSTIINNTWATTLMIGRST